MPGSQFFAVMFFFMVICLGVDSQFAMVREEALTHPPTHSPIRILIPDGVHAGDKLRVQATWGGEFDIIVPDGVQPGDPIELELPAAPDQMMDNEAEVDQSLEIGGRNSEEAVAEELLDAQAVADMAPAVADSNVGGWREGEAVRGSSTP